MRGNPQALFGKRPTEKDPAKGTSPAVDFTPVAAQSWKLGPYLGYWLEHVVKPTRRPATYELYEMTVRLHLAPALGKYPFKRLSVPIVQSLLNGKLRAGASVRNVHFMRQVLSAALSRAVGEELVPRNVARFQLACAS